MTNDTIREASCACGRLKLRLAGDPQYVSSCACQACQRRSGSPFGVAAFFNKDQVAGQDGEARVFRRTAESGNQVTYRFCPECGSSVWWEPEAMPERVAVAGGAFADPNFPAPQRMVWTDYKAAWVRPAEGVPLFPRAPT